ncbi:hypothetical protein [Alteromonas sp. ASW11-130]|nr:hypothetical protein [Alteromonas sp. ASW11-130]MCW8091875.1 hypothetical protein [Alteromonas sp. ASW11-130]
MWLAVADIPTVQGRWEHTDVRTTPIYILTQQQWAGGGVRLVKVG